MVVKEDLRVGRVVEDKADFLNGSGIAKEGLDDGGDDRGGLFARIAVSAGGDGGEGDGAKRMLGGESERGAVAGGEGAVVMAAGPVGKPLGNCEARSLRQSSRTRGPPRR